MQTMTLLQSYRRGWSGFCRYYYCSFLFKGIVVRDIIFNIFTQFCEVICVLMSGDVFALKGQCHKIFCSRFFSWIIFPRAPENRALGQFQIFSKIRGDIRKSRYTIGLNDTVNFPLVPLVWLIPVANLHSLTKFVRIYLQNLQICDLWTQYFLQFADMRFVSRIFFGLQTLTNSLFFSLQIHI